MMKTKNIDGIKSPKNFREKPKTANVKAFARPVPMDAISRPAQNKAVTIRRPAPRQAYVPTHATYGPHVRIGGSFFKLPRSLRGQTRAFVAACVLVITFMSGAWYSASTPRTSAEEQLAFPEAVSSVPSPIFLANLPTSTPPAAAVSNDTLFNTPLELLKEYLAAVNAPDQMEVRKAKLHQYLLDWKSPLAEFSDTIAEQDHWKFILAISFAESTMGKRCVDNNCSGIGVAPGHPLWRKYKTLGHWILDLNRLLEKRYKDKTLEQMCGVYVQPCNPNWLLATKQILGELEEKGIE